MPPTVDRSRPLSAVDSVEQSGRASTATPRKRWFGRSSAPERALPDADIYSRDYLLSSALDGISHYEAGGLSVVRQREIDLLDVHAGQRVLDLGCGRGETTTELVRRGADVVAMDYSWDAAELTHEGAAGAAAVLQADGTRLPFADASFDRVLLSDVIEHVPWTMSIQMMNEVHRVLRPDGQALLHTAPNVWFIAMVKRPLVLLLKLTRRKPALERFALYDQLRFAMHPNELSPVTLRRLMRATRFDDSVSWVDRDVLRSGSSDWTSSWSPRLVSALSATAGSWPLRLLLGNDMYSIAVSDRSALPDARRRRRASFPGAQQ